MPPSCRMPTRDRMKCDVGELCNTCECDISQGMHIQRCRVSKACVSSFARRHMSCVQISTHSCSGCLLRTECFDIQAPLSCISCSAHHRLLIYAFINAEHEVAWLLTSAGDPPNFSIIAASNMAGEYFSGLMNKMNMPCHLSFSQR